ncbi:HlyD family secretion protein [Pseudoruegeria sp. HB172150]|uniref:HlyD family secretion protein n=1 Tax=Pseudoruegeria sp. HB172150 TaxID=2721164 RepID=UPI0015579023|nr:HlyD family efflux transporter periplasmic adaptor subunit [Pseudoruegeria sp. HB172150]
MKKSILVLVAIAVIAVGYLAYRQSQASTLPEDIASGNGRVEAVQVDVSSLIAGRVASIEVLEGDLVDVDDLLVTINADTLAAQLAQAEAEVDAGLAQVAAAQASIKQAEAQLALAREELTRTETLTDRGTATLQTLDTRRTDVEVATANLAAAEATMRANESAVDASRAVVDQIRSNLDDTELLSPVYGRVLYRLAEPGEVVSAGSRVLTLVDMSQVFLEFFLPATQAHRVAVGAEARIRLDLLPDAAIPATVTFVSPVSQFTPKTVETAEERENLVFRVRVRVPQELVERFIDIVRTGIRGVAYVRLATSGAPSPWPDDLQVPDFDALTESLDE